MKLKDLAEKASRLPDLDFSWGGVEHYHEDVFKQEVVDLPSLIKYVDSLRNRMAEMTLIFHDLAGAYNKLRDAILEADIES